jgi:sigma-B regulation protein RsbU (phosphoserine phosphatase)
MRILLAEDDAATRTVVAKQLEALGHTVLCASDGAQAWEIFQKEAPPLVITDWLMPNLDGAGLCRNIRQAAGSTYTFIVILTAVERSTGYLDGMAAGADDYATKPCDGGELAVRIRVAERILSLQHERDTLHELLPLCPRCKRIRNEHEQWQQVETYITRMADAQFSHGVCPECYEKHMKPQLEAWKRRNTTS